MAYVPVDYPLRQCEWCRVEFKPKSKRSAFCGMECRREFRVRSPEHQPPKTCRGCSKVFNPPHSAYSRTHYCSRECRVKHKGGYQSAAWIKTHTYLCEECGDEFVFVRNTSGKYCSWSCGAVASGREKSLVLGRSSPVVWLGCSECGVELGPRPRLRVTCSEICCVARTDRIRMDAIEQRKDNSIQECAECGERYRPSSMSQKKYCGSSCSKRRHSRVSRGTRRMRKFSNGVAESFDPLKVFADDGWRCYICKVDTPKELRGSYEDTAPELDHVVPLVAGGSHTRDNVRCCCRSCNSKKGAMIYQAGLVHNKHNTNQQHSGGGVIL